MISFMKVTVMIFQVVVLLIATIGGSAFLAPAPKATSSVKIYATSNQDGKESIKEGLVAAGSSLQSQLASAFSNLDESDQYDAVLTGLCAKILDEPSLSGDDVIVALKDPISLLGEMNSRRVKAGSRSLMALVDVSPSILVSNIATVRRSLSRS
jgi:capsular polysaccharide biosynthesis protein